jgi:hypothetical protein
VIPEIDIRRAANLMLKCYSDEASRGALVAPTSSQQTAITTARRRDAGLPTLSLQLANKIPSGP